MDYEDVGKVEMKIETTRNEFIQKLDDILNMIKVSSMIKKTLGHCDNIQIQINKIKDLNNEFTKNLKNFNRSKYRLKLFDMNGEFESISHYAQYITQTFKISGKEEINQQISDIVSSICSKSKSESEKITDMVKADNQKPNEITYISIKKNSTDSISAACSEIVRLKSNILPIIIQYQEQQRHSV